MPSKKKPDESKIDRLKNLYDLDDPSDLFTILPQEMEMAEVFGFISELTGEEKKVKVMDLLLDLAAVNNIELDENTLSVFIDVICDVSKGKYALNKENK